MYNKLDSFIKKSQYNYMVLSSKYQVERKGGHCPACNKDVSHWVPYGTKKLRKNAECPNCRAAERDRIEMLYWRKHEQIYREMKVLHFAPEKAQWEYFGNLIEERNYWPVDIDGSMENIKRAVDITDISWPNNFFDLIICNHVLEHVKAISKALDELFRVLSDNGKLIITVPIDEAHKTREDPNINTDEKRIKYYGEANHVRMFGTDFAEILLQHGLLAERVYARDFLQEKEIRVAGLKKEEYFWICKRDNSECHTT